MNASDHPNRLDTGKYNILIVDDDERVVARFEREFEQAENLFNIDKTTDGRRALNLLEQKSYDLIITDLVMPEVNGIEVLKKAKTLQPDTEVILITEYSSAASALDALHFGAFDYIPKPFNLSELKQKIMQAVEKRRAFVEKKDRVVEMETLCGAVAYDLKTAVLSIKEFAKILEQEHAEQLQSEGRFIISRILANVASLESMIQGFLEYTRIGKVEFPWVNIETSALIQEIASSLSLALKENNTMLILDENFPTVYFYRSGLQQVFRHLIENAIIYSRREADSYIKIGAIRNHGEKEKEHHEFYIEDNGIGISEENAERIFDIFGPEERRIDGKGCGIGLAIVKKILENARCSVKVDSTTAGGTVFHFTLPRQRA